MKYYRVKCSNCGCTQLVEDADICLMPWPHVECIACRIWIPCF